MIRLKAFFVAHFNNWLFFTPNSRYLRFDLSGELFEGEARWAGGYQRWTFKDDLCQVEQFLRLDEHMKQESCSAKGLIEAWLNALNKQYDLPLIE
ncbi:MAG: hypothetical protein VX185_09900 [Pseudomonadota bacterium]|nr:hypothetical protein [Pseudomonadota bacterium]